MYRDDIFLVNPNISQNRCSKDSDSGWPAIPYILLLGSVRSHLIFHGYKSRTAFNNSYLSDCKTFAQL